MFTRKLIAVWAGLLASLGGCTIFGSAVSCMGIGYYPPSQVSNVRTSTSKQIKPGESLAVRIDAPYKRSEYKVSLIVRGEEDGGVIRRIPFLDDGTKGDSTRDDGEWYCEFKCPEHAKDKILLSVEVRKRYESISDLGFKETDIAEYDVVFPANGES